MPRTRPTTTTVFQTDGDGHVAEARRAARAVGLGRLVEFVGDRLQRGEGAITMKGAPFQPEMKMMAAEAPAGSVRTEVLPARPSPSRFLDQARHRCRGGSASRSRGR